MTPDADFPAGAYDPEELLDGYKAPAWLPKLLDDADAERDDR